VLSRPLRVSYFRAEKAEEEVAELVKKSQQLEVDLDQAKEQLLTTTQQLEEKEQWFSHSSILNSSNTKLFYKSRS
jgi:hypothetical protein